jgi:hypothetical protein
MIRGEKSFFAFQIQRKRRSRTIYGFNADLCENGVWGNMDWPETTGTLARKTRRTSSEYR